MDRKVGTRDLYYAGLEIAFYGLIVFTVILFLLAMLQVLVAEEGQALFVWPLVLTMGATLVSVGGCWVLQGKMLRECGRGAK